jgi:hypothetical protein
VKSNKGFFQPAKGTINNKTEKLLLKVPVFHCFETKLRKEVKREVKEIRGVKELKKYLAVANTCAIFGT